MQGQLARLLSRNDAFDPKGVNFYGENSYQRIERCEQSQLIGCLA